MNLETLERLLVDRACGELSEDAAELLEAYLAGHPGPVGNEIEDTVALARLALKSEKPTPLPEPRYAVKARIGWSVSAWAIGMAACFAAGMLLTRFTLRPASGPPEAQVAQALALAAPREQVVWTSPVRMPFIKSKP